MMTVGRVLEMRTATLLAVLLCGCDLTAGTSRDEVAWAQSPDGRIDAILLEINGGATTSFGYVVELHPASHRGEKPVEAGKFYAAVRSNCAYGIDLHWVDRSTLALRFESARQVAVPASVNVSGRPIRILAQSGMVNSGAPCGGMLVNRPPLKGG